MNKIKGKQIIDLKSKMSNAVLGDSSTVVEKTDNTLLSNVIIREPVVVSEKTVVDNRKKEKESAAKKDEKTAQIAELFDIDIDEEKNWNIFEQATHIIDPEKLQKYKKWLVVLIAGVLVFLLVLFIIVKFSGKKVEKGDWYAVKLNNSETYFGQTSNISADPVILSHVYTSVSNSGDQASNIQLVKRGKEAYGPTGTMNIIRSQIVYLEPLQSDSRVLQAIMDYEKN